MNLHQLELFCAVVELGSFALASERLHISQPALSIQVKRLERRLGVNLLHRTRQGPALTEAGRAVYDSAKGIFEQRDGLQRQLEEIRTGRTGRLAVAMSPTGVLHVALSLIQEFKRRHPTASVIPRVGTREQILEWVAQGAVDIAFEWGPIDDARLNRTTLMPVRFLVTTSPQHAFAARRSVAVKDFLREPFADLDHGPGTPSFVEESLLRAGVRPRTVVRVPSIDAVKRLIEADLAIGMLSSISMERELEAGLLKALPLQGFPLKRDLAVISRKDGPISRAAGWFLELAAAYSGKRALYSARGTRAVR